MTNTNKAHEEAVQRVKDKLENLNAFSDEVEFDKQSGVDIHATSKDGATYYFTVIKGTKKESKSVYSAVSSKTWEFVNNGHTKDLFFVSEIEKNGNFAYYIYTPVEMWHRSKTPYVHLKCNPLTEIDFPLTELNDSINLTPQASRYKGEDKMLEKLKDLSSLLDKLKKIKG